MFSMPSALSSLSIRKIPCHVSNGGRCGMRRVPYQGEESFACSVLRCSRWLRDACHLCHPLHALLSIHNASSVSRGLAYNRTWPKADLMETRAFSGTVTRRQGAQSACCKVFRLRQEVACFFCRNRSIFVCLLRVMRGNHDQQTARNPASRMCTPLPHPS